VLTFSRSDVSRGVVSTLPGHHILKIGCQIPSLMSSKQVVEDNGVVCVVIHWGRVPAIASFERQ
jgi:hypothetical protein